MNDQLAAGWASWPRAHRLRQAAASRWGELVTRVGQVRPLVWLGGLILATWAVWRFEPFYRVGMASQDQVNFSLQALEDFWGEVAGHAKAQGRVYFLLTKVIDLWLAARPETWRVHAINIAVYALSALWFAQAVLRTRAERLLYVWLFASVMWASYHHLPPAAYPSVNHLPFALWALAAWWVRRTSARGNDGNSWLWLGFGALAYLGLFQYEPVACMTLCVLGWIVLDEPRPRLRRQLGLALGGAALSYAATYLGWRGLYPTSYDGAMGGELSLWNVLRVALAYGVGALPFCEAYADQISIRFGDRGGQAFLRLAPEPSQAPELTALLLTALAVAALLGCHGGLARSAAPSPRRRVLLQAGLGVLLLLAINGPLGLSAKYQQWVKDYDETYLTSQLALYAWVLLGTLALSAAHRYVRLRGRPALFALLAAGAGALSLPVQAHNREITSRQRANLARWEGVTALAAYAERIEQAFVVAPDLYFTSFIGERDWTKYWGRYVSHRFGGWLNFRATPPTDHENFARVQLHHFADGSFRALSIQAPDSVTVVSRPRNAPRALIAADGTAVALDWRDAERLLPSSFCSLTLREPAQLLGAGQRIELMWVWPERPLAVQR